MKQTLTIISLLVSLIVSATNPEVAWQTRVHDFGAFNEDDGNVSYTFKYVNSGDCPLTIVCARTSCGCTTPKYSHTPIAPGDSGIVTVTFNPTGRPGRFNKKINITFNEINTPIALSIKGSVIGSEESIATQYPIAVSSNIRLSRPAVIFGQVKKGSTRSVTINAYNTSVDTIYPKTNALPPYLSATIVPDTVAPAEQFAIICYFKSAQCDEYGFISDSIPLKDCSIPVTANVEEDFSKLTPKQLAKSPEAYLANGRCDFGKVGTEHVEQTLTLKNNGQSKLIVRRIYTTDNGIDVSIDNTTIKPGKSTTIHITVRPDELTGALLNARINLITNDPINPNQTIRVVGQR